MLLCQHEKIAVQIAHGYAKATGRPMVAIVHDVVGLLHATMGIYYAYVDRAPIFVIGATGPMDESRRRPFIDWIHTANVQGEQVRNYVKWDYQPGSIEGVPDSFARAYGAMMTEPQGPIYMCYDAWLQEQPLTAQIDLPSRRRQVPVPMAADPAALAAVADRLLAANFRCCSPNMSAARPTASTISWRSPKPSAPPSTTSMRGSTFPIAIKLNLSMEKERLPRCRSDPFARYPRLGEADPPHRPHQAPQVAALSAGCEMIEIGFGDIGLSKWSMDYTRMPNCSLRVLGDTATAIPALTQMCREKIARTGGLAERIAARGAEIAKRHDALFAAWAAMTVARGLGRLADHAAAPRP
jgi:acetolactate synthase-1/2/3 large subunit